MISWKLIGVGFVPLAGGVGIAYPVINSFNTSAEIVLKELKDFKEHCWISISGGERDQSSETNKKLLVCPVSAGTSKASFYLYNESSDKRNELPREVEGLEHENTSNAENIILSLKKGNLVSTQNEVISVSNWQWKDLYGLKRNLKQDCTVNWQEDTKKINCSDKQINEKLTKFQ